MEISMPINNAVENQLFPSRRSDVDSERNAVAGIEMWLDCAVFPFYIC
jgi:hypothetical protein